MGITHDNTQYSSNSALFVMRLRSCFNKTVAKVVVYYTNCLHEGVNNRAPDEAEPSLFQIQGAWEVAFPWTGDQ